MSFPWLASKKTAKKQPKQKPIIEPDFIIKDENSDGADSSEKNEQSDNGKDSPTRTRRGSRQLSEK
ncbi:hypothetical protein P7245_22410 [Vibrio parahaemolyticus]|nr:hypothetical protein [Vibrio parahaemolyticus]